MYILMLLGGMKLLGIIVAIKMVKNMTITHFGRIAVKIVWSLSHYDILHIYITDRLTLSNSI